MTEKFNNLSESYKKQLEEHGLAFEDFTCSNCKMVDGCPFAFDMYNTDGDCLMEK